MNYVEPTGDEARQQAFDRPPLMKAPEIESVNLIEALNAAYPIRFVGAPTREVQPLMKAPESNGVRTVTVVSGGNGYEAKPVDLPYVTVDLDRSSNPYWRSLGSISMIDWERLAGWYAAALAEANSKIRNLEDRLAELEKPAAPVEPSRSDVLANCMRADRTLDAYGR